MSSSSKSNQCGAVLLLLLFIFSIAKIHKCDGKSVFDQRQPLFVIIKNEIRHRPSGGHIRFPIDHGLTYDGLNEQQGIHLSKMK